MIRRFKARVQAMADERVAAYVATPEFGAMVEELKRRKREEMLAKCVCFCVWFACVFFGGRSGWCLFLGTRRSSRVTRILVLISTH